MTSQWIHVFLDTILFRKIACFYCGVNDASELYSDELFTLRAS